MTNTETQEISGNRPKFFGSLRPKIWLRRAPAHLHNAIRKYAANRHYEAGPKSLENLMAAIRRVK